MSPGTKTNRGLFRKAHTTRGHFQPTVIPAVYGNATNNRQSVLRTGNSIGVVNLTSRRFFSHTPVSSAETLETGSLVVCAGPAGAALVCLLASYGRAVTSMLSASQLTYPRSERRYVQYSPWDGRYPSCAYHKYGSVGYVFETHLLPT